MATSIKPVKQLAEASSGYKHYIVLASSWKDQSEAQRPQKGPVLERKAFKSADDSLWYDMVAGEVVCRLPIYQLNEDDYWEKTGQLCMHIADNTNNLRKHMKTSMHLHGGIKVPDGNSGGVTKDEKDAARIFYRAFMLHWQSWLAHEKSEEFAKEDVKATADEEEAKRCPGISQEDITASRTANPTIKYPKPFEAPVQRKRKRMAPTPRTEEDQAASGAANPTTSRTSVEPESDDDEPTLHGGNGPMPWTIPLFRSGRRVGEINWPVVKAMLANNNRRSPCAHCASKGYAPNNGQKKAGRCSIVDPECANHGHFEWTAYATTLKDTGATPAPDRATSRNTLRGAALAAKQAKEKNGSRLRKEATTRAAKAAAAAKKAAKTATENATDEETGGETSRPTTPLISPNLANTNEQIYQQMEKEKTAENPRRSGRMTLRFWR